MLSPNVCIAVHCEYFYPEIHSERERRYTDIDPFSYLFPFILFIRSVQYVDAWGWTEKLPFRAIANVYFRDAPAIKKAGYLVKNMLLGLH